MKPTADTVSKFLFEYCQNEFGISEAIIRGRAKTPPLPAIRHAIIACNLKYATSEPMKNMTAPVARNHAIVYYVKDNMSAWLVNKDDRFSVMYNQFCKVCDSAPFEIVSIDSQIEYHKKQIEILQQKRLKQIQNETRSGNY